MQGNSSEQIHELNKAAILAMAMNKDVLANVLKHLNEDELTRLMKEYEQEQANSTIDQTRLLAVGHEFIGAAGQGATGHFKEALVLALGEDSAAQILRQDRWLEIATRTRPATLAALLKDERPGSNRFYPWKISGSIRRTSCGATADRGSRAKYRADVAQYSAAGCSLGRLGLRH
jgi:flagellar motor switch protein FliG